MGNLFEPGVHVHRRHDPLPARAKELADNCEGHRADLSRLQAIKRLLRAAPNLVGVVVITFILTRAKPGDTAAYFAGAAATLEAVEQIRQQLGVVKPLPERFMPDVARLVRFDLGLSLILGQPGPPLAH